MLYLVMSSFHKEVIEANSTWEAVAWFQKYTVFSSSDKNETKTLVEVYELGEESQFNVWRENKSDDDLWETHWTYRTRVERVG